MNALIIIGHPASSSFNHALANAVEQSWKAAGLAVVTHDLGAEGFDPRLTVEETRGQPSRDPLVQRHCAELERADVLAVIHPVMWGMPPAIVKGWIDRVFALNRAYGFPEGAAEGSEPIGLLPLRGALILNTSNTLPEREMERFGDPLQRIWQDCVLGYCSAADVARHTFAPLVPSSDATRADWLKVAGAMALSLLEQTS